MSTGPTRSDNARFLLTQRRVVVARASATLGRTARAQNLLGFRRVPEQLTDRGGQGFANSPELQASLLQQRRRQPTLTVQQFIRNATGDDERRLRALLGDAQFVLEARPADPDWWAAWQVHLDDLRYVPRPADGGWSYPHGDALPARMPRPPEDVPVLYPMNHPVVGIKNVWLPGIAAAKTRGNQFVGHHALCLWRPNAPPRYTASAADVIGMLSGDLAAARVAFRDADIPSLVLTPTQMAFLRVEGDPPVIAWERLEGDRGALSGFKGSITENSRVCTEARFELATRLAAAGVPDAADLRKLDALKRFLKQRPKLVHEVALPNDPRNWSPFARLTADELIALATADRKQAPEIVLHVSEWEHDRPDRTSRDLKKLLLRLGVSDPESLSTVLSGVVDPSNLMLVTPFEHARLDFEAASWGGDHRARMQDYPRGVFREVALDDNMNVIPDLPFARTPEDIAAGVTSVRPHYDRPRFDNPWGAYRPEQIIDVRNTLEPLMAPDRLTRMDNGSRDFARGVIEQINLILQRYGRPDLALPMPPLPGVRPARRGR
jgi:hypothetical protein